MEKPKRSISITALAAAAMLASTQAPADTYRCGRKLIHTGDTSAEVLRLCGEPRLKDRGHEDIRLEGRVTRLPVQRWHYRKNSRSLWRIVMIYRGRVAAIETGGR